METCCVCQFEDGRPGLVQLWRNVFACPTHTKAELVKAHLVFVELRSAEVAFYKETLKNPGALVWASSSLAEFRCQPQEEAMPRLPDGLPVLMIPDTSNPTIFAVDDVLASVLMSVFRGIYRSRSELTRLAESLVRG